MVTIGWKQMFKEYRESKKVQGLTEATLYETALTLRHFKRLMGQCNSRQITQNNIDKFILERGNEVKRTTLNKDIRNLKTFVNWCRKKRYANSEIENGIMNVRCFVSYAYGKLRIMWVEKRQLKLQPFYI